MKRPVRFGVKAKDSAEPAQKSRKRVGNRVSLVASSAWKFLAIRARQPNYLTVQPASFHTCAALGATAKPR